MKNAIGIDIVEIKRLERSSKKWGKAFLEKIYTPREIEYSFSKRYPAQHLAARFAAKEAMFKALGEVTQTPVGWKNIEVVNDSAGKPRILWHGDAEKLKKKIKIKNALVSLSHTERYAVATAMIFY